MSKDHGASIKNDEQYEALRRQGMGKEKAARIANSDSETSGRRGGSRPPYEEWTRDALYQRARELDIAGRSKMSKADLIAALRDR